MSFHVLLSDIENVMTAGSVRVSGWSDALDPLARAVTEFTSLDTFTGQGAAAAKARFEEAEMPVIVGLSQVLTEFSSRLLLYVDGWHQLEPGTDAVIDEDSLSLLEAKARAGRVAFEDEARTLSAAADGVADLVNAPPPSTQNLAEKYAAVENEAKSLREDGGELEAQQKYLLADYDALYDPLNAFLDKCLTLGIDSYTPGSLVQTQELKALGEAVFASADGLKPQAELIEKAGLREGKWAKKRAKELEDEAAAQRVRDSWWQVASAALAVVIGGAAIVLSVGAATPIVVAAGVAGTASTAYGVSEGIEGAQNIYYGSSGDTTTVAENPLRDSVFGGNQTAYDIFGFAATSAAGGIAGLGRGALASTVGLSTRQASVTAAKAVVGSLAVDTGATVLATTATGLAVQAGLDPGVAGFVGADTSIVAGYKGGVYVGKIATIRTSLKHQPAVTAIPDKAVHISDLEHQKLEKWRARQAFAPSDDIYLKYKHIFDDPRYFDQESGDIIWPGTNGDPNIDGFVNGKYEVKVLEPGTVIDRYGSKYGNFMAPEGVTFSERSLPPWTSISVFLSVPCVP